jgi:high mobility group protein B2
MAKKAGRDSGAPKRNMSAYLLYQNAMREQFKALNPGMTFGQLAKYTSAMYSELPPSEKEAWVARAEADKARYLHELASYIPPPGYDPKGDAIVSPINTKSGRKGKPEKDVNAPKRNMSAYLLYQNAMREQFKRENPGMTFGQLAKYTSHMYKNLTPEEKATWEARAAQDKARYDQEIANYVPPPGHDARGVLIEDHRPRKRNKRGPKDPLAPKRASGAYVFFTNEMRPKVLQEYPGIKFVELGKVLGERWRALTPVQKKKHEDVAANDKVRFQLEMQVYTANQAAAAPPIPVPEPSQPAYHYPDPTQADAYAAAYSQHDPYAQHHYQAA